MSLMRRELLPETPKLFCLNLLLDQHYFNRQLIWEKPPKGQDGTFPNYGTEYERAGFLDYAKVARWLKPNL